MPTIEITVVAKNKITITVEFPFYYSFDDCFDNGGGFVTAKRIEENGSVYDITRRDSRRDYTIEWELETTKVSTEGYGGYITPDSVVDQSDAKKQYDTLWKQFQEFYSAFQKEVTA